MSFLYKTDIATRRIFVQNTSMIKQLATVGIYVEDQSAAEKFWTEKLGFEVKNKK